MAEKYQDRWVIYESVESNYQHFHADLAAAQTRAAYAGSQTH
jgi:hypothetical protein